MLGEAAGDEIRAVVEFSDGRFDFFAESFADVAFVGNYRRNGEDGHAGFARHMIDAGFPGFLRPFFAEGFIRLPCTTCTKAIQYLTATGSFFLAEA